MITAVRRTSCPLNDDTPDALRFAVAIKCASRGTSSTPSYKALIRDLRMESGIFSSAVAAAARESTSHASKLSYSTSPINAGMIACTTREAWSVVVVAESNTGASLAIEATPLVVRRDHRDSGDADCAMEITPANVRNAVPCRFKSDGNIAKRWSTSN